jgi:hypothetical protein
MNYMYNHGEIFSKNEKTDHKYLSVPLFYPVQSNSVTTFLKKYMHVHFIMGV